MTTDEEYHTLQAATQTWQARRAPQVQQKCDCYAVTNHSLTELEGLLHRGTVMPDATILVKIHDWEIRGHRVEPAIVIFPTNTTLTTEKENFQKCQ